MTQRLFGAVEMVYVSRGDFDGRLMGIHSGPLQLPPPNGLRSNSSMAYRPVCESDADIIETKAAVAQLIPAGAGDLRAMSQESGPMMLGGAVQGFGEKSHTPILLV